MLPKSHKLNTQQFSTVFETGKTVHSDFFMAKFIPTPDGDNFRAGVSVSKKYIKTAVGRNYKNRQIYDALQQYTDKPYWVVLVLKKEGVDISFEEIEKDLEKVFGKMDKK